MLLQPRILVLCLVLPALLLFPLLGSGDEKEKAVLPDFRTQEIEKDLGVGYAVRLVDVNGDKKLDIVVVDRRRVVWYENPTWKRRIIIENQTKPDNVCIAAHDIDGDGKLDFALGAGWKGLNSKEGPIYWLKRGKTLDEKWQVIPIGGEPSVHRIRFADLEGDGKPELIVAPLLGKGSTRAKNWMDAPVRLLALKVPKDPAKDRWTPTVIDESLHVMHNFWVFPVGEGKGTPIVTASYEGVHLFKLQDGKWKKSRIGTGNQDNPKSNRGSSEVKLGELQGLNLYVATIEPWHGHQVVVYTPSTDPKKKLGERHVIDEDLKWGHAVWCADLSGDEKQELIIGVRDDKSTEPGERRGVRIYQATDEKGTKWRRKLIDEGGVAVEDLACADLDNDGDTDIVAVGRQTHNVRIYWNQRKK